MLCSSDRFLCALGWGSWGRRVHGLPISKPRARGDSTGCTSAWHQLRAQPADLCVQQNLGKKLKQMSWDADQWGTGLCVSQVKIFNPGDSGDLNAAFWHLRLVSFTSSGCTGCKEVPVCVKLHRTKGAKVFYSAWYQRGSMLRAFGLLWLLFVLVCLKIFRPLMWSELAAG